MGKDINSNIVKLATDIALNRTSQFENNDKHKANEVLRNAFRDVLGLGETYTRREYDRAMKDNGTKFFRILEEVLDESIDWSLRNSFTDWVEYRNLARGDKNEFVMPNNSLFEVSIVSDGNKNLNRQRMAGQQKFPVNTDLYAIKIYEEADRFLAGNVDWNQLVALVGESMAIDANNRIITAVVDQFSKVSAEYKLTALGGIPTERQILELAQKVSAKTGQRVTIYGTKLALNNLTPDVSSDGQDERRNATGYYGTIAGINLVEIEQQMKPNSNDFLIGDDFLLVLPETRDRMVKVVNEGEAQIDRDDVGRGQSMDLEYFANNRVGIAVIPSSVYGYIEFS